MTGIEARMPHMHDIFRQTGGEGPAGAAIRPMRARESLRGCTDSAILPRVALQADP